MLCIILLCISCTMTPAQLFDARVEVAREYFDIDFDIPRLFWLDEDTYEIMVKKNPRLKTKAAFIFGDCVFARTIFRDSFLLQSYFDHELAHYVFDQSKDKEQSELFAQMYTKIQENNE